MCQTVWVRWLGKGSQPRKVTSTFTFPGQREEKEFLKETEKELCGHKNQGMEGTGSNANVEVSKSQGHGTSQLCAHFDIGKNHFRSVMATKIPSCQLLASMLKIFLSSVAPT